MSVWGNTELRSCSNISKERLDGRRVVWVGLAFNHGKGYANRNLFWRSHFRSPFMDLKKTKTVFWCCGFQSFRNSPDEGGLYCSWLSSAADLPVKDALEDFWLTTANTINPGDDISHVPRISCYRQHRGASTVTVNLPAASQSSRILCIAEYLSLDILFWLEYLCHTDGNAERQTPKLSLFPSASSSLTFLVRVSSVKP